MAEETTEQDKTTPPDDVPLPAEAAATEAPTEEVPKPAEAPASAPAEDEPENFRSEHNLSPTIDAFSFWALQACSWHRPPQRRQPTTRHDQAILDGLLIAGLWCSHQDRRSRGLYSVQVTACSTREK